VAEQVNDVANYLARHAISGDPRVIPDRGESAAEQLTRLAQQEGADLLVAGAYGHSRLGEWFFGGVTRDLLAASPICCLMSH
jgi:nucleotide-binding universal stress UspA family protein